MTELTEQERKIIEVLRDLVAFEVVEIHKDKLGVADTFLLKRSQKLMVTPQDTRAVKSGINPL
jgi:hypothetical protein